MYLRWARAGIDVCEAKVRKVLQQTSATSHDLAMVVVYITTSLTPTDPAVPTVYNAMLLALLVTAESDRCDELDSAMAKLELIRPMRLNAQRYMPIQAAHYRDLDSLSKEGTCAYC